MSEDIKSEVILTTQSLLSKHISKPPLTEKLLRKPPFRFIHDITTSVMRKTGFLEGLFSMDEFNPENIKTKESKMLFLEKLISAVNLSTGANIAAHPHKIVAGLDATKTNKLLQTMAEALDKKIDSTKAVEQVLHMMNKDITQPNTFKKPHNNVKQDSMKTKQNLKNGSKAVDMKKHHNSQPGNPSIFKTKQKIKESEKAELVDKTLVNSSQNKKIKPKEPTVSAENSEGKDYFYNLDNSVTESRESSDISGLLTTVKQAHVSKNEELLQESDHIKLPKSFSKEEDSKTDQTLKRPLSSKAGYKKSINQNVDAVANLTSSVEETNQREEVINDSSERAQMPSSFPLRDILGPKEVKSPKPVVRPASARPGAPRIRDRGNVLSSNKDDNLAPEAVNIILDTEAIPKHDVDNLVTIETPSSYMLEDKSLNEIQLVTEEDQGHLVSQIIETKKELEDTSEDMIKIINDVQTNWNISTQKENSVGIEVEKLQSALQRSTKAVNPLGKLIDFLQEDTDCMQKELENWTITHQELAKTLINEEKFTNERMQPFINQLEDISQLIQEQLEETNMIKAMIIYNDEKLKKYLTANSGHHSVLKRL